MSETAGARRPRTSQRVTVIITIRESHVPHSGPADRMQRTAASVHAKSTPVLKTPSAFTTIDGDADRVALANSISASLLRLVDDSSPTAPAATVVPFAITDLLEQLPHPTAERPRPTRKRAKPGHLAPRGSPQKVPGSDAATGGSVLAPLSPSHEPMAASMDPLSMAECNNRMSGNTQIRPSPTRSTKGSSIAADYVQRLDRPENTELFTYASALCHRVTGRYLSKELLQRDPEAQRKEIARIQRDPELLQAISAIRTLSKQFQVVAQDTLGHRKELGHTLFRIEESYLKLFEKLLEISLRMYWRYEQDHDAARRADKATIQYWQEMHNWKAGEATKLQKLLEGKEIVLRAQAIQLADLEKQCEEFRREVGDQRALEEQLRVLRDAESRLREEQRVLREEFTQFQRKHEEMIQYERGQIDEMREQHRHLMDEMRVVLRDKEQQLTHHERAIRELTVLTTAPVTTAASTQTLVDDDGLWDAEDGVPRFVSKDLVHRMLWRRFDAFVRCRNCRGRPLPLPRGGGGAVYRDPGSLETDQDYVDVWSLTRGERKTTKKATKRLETIESEWELPEAIRLFLSNLPKSVVAFPFYKLEDVIRQIEAIYDDKFLSDQADEADGVAREELPRFICEFFLKTHGLRQSAEIGLYRLLLSVKNHYHRHSHVHQFARFCSLLRADGIRDGDDGSAPSTLPPVASGLMTRLTETPRRGYLDRSFLRVFLHARHFLLRAPPPRLVAIPKAQQRIGQPTTMLQPPPQPHVIQLDGLRAWVALDHGVAIIRWYLNFLPEDTVIAFCREVEHSTAIYAGRALTEVSGNRLAVRAEMRKAMLVNQGAASEHAPADDGGRRHPQQQQQRPRIVVDAHKVLLLLMHALEQRQAVMEKDLITMFDAGDVNHDCVLSLDEFKAIIRTRMPQFSDRRILRMFREALMGGSDQSFALSMDAFVHVCSDHGLAALLPDDRWRDPFESTPPPDPSNAPTNAGQKHQQRSPSKLLATAAIKALGASTRSSTTKALGIATEPSPPPQVEDKPGTDAIPEELPEDPQTATTTSALSPRAEEVDEDETLWEW